VSRRRAAGAGEDSSEQGSETRRGESYSTPFWKAGLQKDQRDLFTARRRPRTVTSTVSKKKKTHRVRSEKDVDRRSPRTVFSLGKLYFQKGQTEGALQFGVEVNPVWPELPH